MKWACEEETHGPSIGIFSFTYLDEKCQGAPLKNRHDSFPSPSQHDRVELFYDIGVFSVALRPSLSQIDLVAGQQLAFPLEWTSLREEEEEGAWSSGRGSETVLVLIYSHTLVLYSGYI